MRSSSFFGFFKTTTYPSVGEMSVQYNPNLNKYVMLYADKNNNVVMTEHSSRRSSGASMPANSYW
jgi:hypothetical protein